MKKTTSLIAIFLLCALYAAAQNPFARYGYKVTVGTMTNGRFPEFHDLTDTVRIGDVLFDANTGKIVEFLEAETKMYDVPVHVASRFITPDPHAERYYNISPYAYANNNPIRFIDPDGRDFWDKVMGIGIGVVTNIIPGTNIRASYSPTDAADYNNSLQGTDAAMMVVGGAMIVGGTDAIAAGGSIALVGGGIAASGVGAPVGGATAAAGGATALAGGAAIIGGGVLMVNSANNQSNGYNYDGKSRTSSKVENTTKSSRGKESINNIKTDVSKGEFGDNLEKSGYEKSVSKDGKVVNYTKGEKKYSVRDNNSSGHGGATADVYQDETKILKIRLDGN